MKYIPLSAFFLTPLATLIFTSCSMGPSHKSDKHQMEMTVNKLRTDLEDMKHDLNSYEIEHHILEGKVIDQEAAIISLKEGVFDEQGAKIAKLKELLTQTEKLLHSVKNKQSSLQQDLRELVAQAKDTTAALSQYKEKFSHFEKSISSQNVRFEEFSDLRSRLDKILVSLTKEVKNTYVVKVGDTLEKIANRSHTTVDRIKKINHLTSDTILVGQELSLPEEK